MVVTILSKLISPAEPDTCYYALDNGFFYRGPANMTSRGQCEPWASVSKFDWFHLYQMVGLEGNECRNSLLFDKRERPWCYVKGLKVLCEVPKCEGRYIMCKCGGVGPV